MEDFKIKVGVQLEQNAGSLIQQQLNAMNLSLKINDIKLDSNKTKSTSGNLGKEAGNTFAREYEKSLKQIKMDNLFNANKMKSIQQISTYMAQNTRAAKQFGAALLDIQQRMTVALDPAELRQLSAEFIRIKARINEAGLAGRSFGQEFGNIVGKFSSWIGVSTIVMSTIHGIQNAFGEIKNLDTALVDLNKTTNATSKELRSFYFEANNIAKSIGESTIAVINATSAWSRFGYSIQEATIMAKNSAILSSISPEMNIEQATDTYISSMKAFGIEAENTLDEVASKINAIGNTQPVENLEIAEMLKRSASAMAEANNSLDQTIALGTAGNSVVRNAESVGTALKTISLRIRGYDEEVEAYTKDLENLGGEIADLTKTASTPGGLSLFTDENKTTYKSTYDIFKDISEIYDQLSDKNQAALLEAVAGKRQANIAASIITNMSMAEKSMETMKTSAGGAMEEMEVIYDSMDYKINRLSQTGVGIFQNLIDSDAVKLVIDSLTGVLTLVDKLTGAFGGLGTAGGVAFAALATQNKGWTNYTVVDSYALIGLKRELNEVTTISCCY